MAVVAGRGGLINNSTTTVTPGSGFQVLQNQVYNNLGRINFSVGRNNGGPALTGAYTQNGGTGVSTTLSPTATVVTPGPTAATVPAAS